MRRQEISTEQYNEIVAAEKATQDKGISRKLKVLMFRYEGYKNDTIATMTGICSVRVSQLVSEYLENGLEAYTQRKYGGNHRNMSEEEEDKILAKFKIKAEAGQVITAQDIKKAFDIMNREIHKKKITNDFKGDEQCFLLTFVEFLDYLSISILGDEISPSKG